MKDKFKSIHAKCFAYFRIKNSNFILEWTDLINQIIELCYEVSKVVSPIVNSSSPEGIFQDKLGSSKFYFFFFNLIFL